LRKISILGIIFLLLTSTFLSFIPKVEAQATDFVKLTTNPWPDRYPSWSPDGSKIIWTAWSNEWNRALWIMDSDGSNKRKLSDGINVPGQARFSPDGKKIVFSDWLPSTNHRIYIMDSDGSNIKQLTSHDPSYSDQYPNWSPDGKKIIFGRSNDERGHLFIMDPDGSNLQELKPSIEPNKYNTLADFSPDGSKIVYYGIHGGLAIMDANGSNAKILTKDGCFPSFSPDGTKIAYVASDGEIHIINSDGTGDVKITSHGLGGEWLHDWNPDGSSIVYSMGDPNADIWITKLPIEPITLPHTWNYGITCYYLDLDLSKEGYQQSITVNPGKNVEAEIKFQRWSGAGNPSEINQVFLLYSWSVGWNPPSIYTPLWNGISGRYPGITKVVKFSFIAPKDPGTYYIWIRGDAMYSMEDALFNIWNKYHGPPPYSDDGGGIIGKVIVSEKEVSATTLFFDDFENYKVGTFPSAGDWILVWNGRGNEYQVVTDSNYHSPTKSLQLWGQHGWSSGVERRFATDAGIIGFEAYVMVEAYHAEEFSATIAFWNKEKATWGKCYASVVFRSDRYIGVSGAPRADGDILIQSYEPNTWYKVRLILDRTRNVFSVWINDELKASDVKTSDSHEINAIHLSSRWGGIKCYYDDVKVFIVQQAQYYLRVCLDSVKLNNQDLQISNPELRVSPRARINGTVTFTIENVQPGNWITPVIWVASWERGTTDDKVRIVSHDIRATKQFTINVNLTAPTAPGIYYIGMFTGWMYTPDEVASNDHPSQYGDGDDVWDMKQSDWESVVMNGQAPEGAVYRMPGRAIRIVVQQLSVDVWTDKGGQGIGNLNSGEYTIGEPITIYFSVNIDVDGFKAIVIMPDGKEVVLDEKDYYPSRLSAGVYTLLSSTIQEPIGERRVIFKAHSGDQISYDEVRFRVIQPQDTVPPIVKVITPNGGETLYVNDTFRIKWEVSDNIGVTKIHIRLFEDNTQIMVIAADLSNTGYYDWVVQDRPGSNYKIRITAVDAAGNAVADDSDSVFTIVKKTSISTLIITTFTTKVVNLTIIASIISIIAFVSMAGILILLLGKKGKRGRHENNIRKLKEELNKYEGYLFKLEEERKKNTISENVYKMLKEKYETEIEKIKKEIKESAK